MSVRNKAALAGVLAGAAAMTALGAGVAQAGNPQLPSAQYQMCGNVLSGGAGVGGVTVTGTLVVGGVNKATYTTTTAADGGYCLQGNSAMANDVSFNGGVVKLAGSKSPNTVNFGTWGSPGIGVLDFLSHQDSTYSNSAKGFNGTI
ncbi:hypothetical protein M2284_003263 [Rhodococcus sp. LBL1]|nr:hypothetical protein [Rhodococcus sp. LBL1]MDH6685213.1 hypothetical protein [Rhodococcus sp. LBL2]